MSLDNWGRTFFGLFLLTKHKKYVIFYLGDEK